MKKFTELCSIDTYQQQQQQLLKKTEEVKPKNNDWQELGGGLLMACGEKKNTSVQRLDNCTSRYPQRNKNTLQYI